MLSIASVTKVQAVGDVIDGKTTLLGRRAKNMIKSRRDQHGPVTPCRRGNITENSQGAAALWCVQEKTKIEDSTAASLTQCTWWVPNSVVLVSPDIFLPSHTSTPATAATLSSRTKLLCSSVADRHKYRVWYDLISAVPKVPGVGSDDRHSGTGKARGHRGELPVDRLVKGGHVDEAKAIPHFQDVPKHHRDRLQRQSPRGRGHSVSSTCTELSPFVWHTGQSQTRLGGLK